MTVPSDPLSAQAPSPPADDPERCRAGSTDDLYRRAREGDSEALTDLFRKNKHRLGRIVSIRFAVRLARVLERMQHEEWGSDSTSLLQRHDDEMGTEAGLVHWMVTMIEREVRTRSDRTLGDLHERMRTLHFAEAGGVAGADHAQREDFERLIDRRVAELEPEELREVLLLRDYCGADWSVVRERLGLLSIEAAQELHRRAHGRLAQMIRPHLRKSGRGQSS